MDWCWNRLSPCSPHAWLADPLALIAYCLDDPAPADGSAFATCTEVVWLEASSVLPALTAQQGMDIAAVVAMFWAVCWAGRLVVKSLQEK